MKVTGEFAITRWDEEPYYEAATGAKLTKASIEQNYTGELTGSSANEYLMSHKSDGAAQFIGMEYIKVQIGDKKGGFVIEHKGAFDNGVASSDFVIVSGSGEGDFEGVLGQGHFASLTNKPGHAQYEFNLEFTS